MVPEPIRVGIIGAGEVSQVIHLPTLSLLSNIYQVIAICDVSHEAVEHAKKKFHIPHGYQDSKELCTRSDIDLVVVASADEFHTMHATQAADSGKHVLIEKPMALTRDEANAIEDARLRNNVHIFVAYMRRYTPVWGIFLQELQKAGPINFARVFDYSGPNSIFVGQSSTDPQVFAKDISEEVRHDKIQRSKSIAADALGKKAADPRLVKVFRLLGSLGSHDISCMRHAFGGVPDRCTSAFASPSGDFVGATFQYDASPPNNSNLPFQVSYETGIHNIGTFDAYIEAYCQDAVVRIDYDTPYVKGLPITVTVRQNVGPDGQEYEERVLRPTFTDAYTSEFLRLEKALKGSPSPSHGQALNRLEWNETSEMCTPTDAVRDLDIFDMIMQHL